MRAKLLINYILEGKNPRKVISEIIEHGLKAWWLFPDGELEDVTKDGAAGYGDHLGFITMANNPELFGLSDEEGEAIYREYVGEDDVDDEDQDYYHNNDVWEIIDSIFEDGFVRIRYSQRRRELNAEAYNLNDRLIHRLQKAIYELKLKIDRVVLDSHDNSISFIFDYEDFKVADKMSELRRLSIRRN